MPWHSLAGAWAPQHSCLRRVPRLCPYVNLMEQVSVPAPPSYAPFHVTTSNCTIWMNPKPQATISSVPRVQLPSHLHWGHAHRHEPQQTHVLPSFLMGISPVHFYTLLKHAQKTTLSNLTKLLSNYKVLFAISHVISFQTCPVFFLFECIFRAGRFVSKQWEADFEKR